MKTIIEYNYYSNKGISDEDLADIFDAYIDSNKLTVSLTDMTYKLKSAGQWTVEATISINNKGLIIKKHFTNAQTIDAWQDARDSNEGWNEVNLRYILDTLVDKNNDAIEMLLFEDKEEEGQY